MARTDIGIGVVTIVIILVGYFGYQAFGNATTTASGLQTGATSSTSSGLGTTVMTPGISTVYTIYNTLTNGQCTSVGGLPDPRCTPGAIDPNVTQDNIYSTICVAGWTSTIRPNETYTENLKRLQIGYYGCDDTYLGAYEEDHLVPLEVGGSPTSPLNL